MGDAHAARNLVTRLVADCRADMLWVPAYEGGHPDHDVASFPGSAFRAEVPVWEFSEYNFRGGRVRSNEFPSHRGEEIVLELSGDEQRLKTSLLAAYASERVNLKYLRTEREVFRPLASYEYSQPPHPGTLFYRRFAWAAAHPKVNEVWPEEVSRVLSTYRPIT
jgi:LmbE family N-acetylglucosaminyl deacetylase